MGNPPPAFDVLFWNQDAVRLSAGLHKDFVHMALDNTMMKKGEMEVLDSPVDLGKLKVDTYAVAGITDHIVPWQNAYRGVRRLGGDVRFVLSTSGHIQALVNPPGPESKSSYRVAEDAARRARRVRERRADERRQLVARLRRLARRALRPAPQGPQDAGRREAQAARRRAGRVRPRGMSQGAEAPWTDRKLTPVDGGWAGRPLAETRWLLEAARLAVDPVAYGRGVPRGDGRAVLVLPGFMAGDESLLALRGWLRRIGYAPHVCGFRFNVDCSDRALDLVEFHAERAAAETGRRIAVVGHSRGGHFARALGARRPGPRQPRGLPRLGPAGHVRNQLPHPRGRRLGPPRRRPTRRARSPTCFRARCSCAFVQDFNRPFPDEVRLTSVYSQGDGVVRWERSIVDEAENVEVAGSHVGLMANRKAYRVIAAALAEPERPRADA